jgi:hypothetical protein
MVCTQGEGDAVSCSISSYFISTSTNGAIMNKLLLTVSTVSLLFTANVQSAHAEGIGEWFKDIFSNEENIDYDAKMYDEIEDNSLTDEIENQIDVEEYDDIEGPIPIVPHI